MRKILVKIITNRSIRRHALDLAKLILPEHDKKVLLWKQSNFEKTLRLNYDDLNNNSTVFDLGGYEGQWTSDIFSRYCCKIYVFEPVKQYAQNIKRRFKLNKKIFVYQFGLGNKTSTLSLYLNDNATSSIGNSEDLEKVRIIDFKDFIDKSKVKKIDLMKLNIEGGEYDLLEYLIMIDWIKNIKNIQVQFHSFVPDAEKRMSYIQKNLKKTHNLTYQYKFLWENWKRQLK